MSEKAKKKTKRTVVLIVVLALVLGIGMLLWSQANNIKALRFALYTQEERERLAEKNQEAIDAIVAALPVDPMQDLNEEQAAMYQRGEMSEEEALGIIMGNDGTKKPTSSQSKENKRLQELLAKVYLLRSNYVGRLNGLIEEAKSEYIARKKSTGKADKATIGSKYISKGSSLESECDGQMEALLGEIKTELERTGGDLSVVEEIRNTYNSEKSIKKADLINQYLK